MKFHSAVSVLKLLSTKPEEALTVQQIVKKWNCTHSTKLHVRTAQRYMSELCSDSAESPALVQIDDSQKDWKYYLRLSEVANWFMTEEMALQLVLSRQVLTRSFQQTQKNQKSPRDDIAEHISSESVRAKRLTAGLRIVSDGIGRLQATIRHDVLACAMEAIATGQKIKLDYTTAKGRSICQEVSPLGMVAKDGTIYMPSVAGLSDTPIHYALHRIQSAELVSKPNQKAINFDLDKYIQDSHQLSHAMDVPDFQISLKLKVDSKAAYHFSERPLSIEQKISKIKGDSEHVLVEVNVPPTVLLKPFLVSFGAAVEVLEPLNLRWEVIEMLQSSVALYK
jgi:predicted DNA-binding transcriptional regulator YafY